jgi:gas vesicle protein
MISSPSRAQQPFSILAYVTSHPVAERNTCMENTNRFENPSRNLANGMSMAELQGRLLASGTQLTPPDVSMKEQTRQLTESIREKLELASKMQAGVAINHLQEAYEEVSDALAEVRQSLAQSGQPSQELIQAESGLSQLSAQVCEQLVGTLAEMENSRQLLAA